VRASFILGSCLSGIIAAVAIAALGWNRAAALENTVHVEQVVDPGGNLRVPADYRSTYQFLGSWAVAADDGQGSKELHIVYASPGTVEAYRRTGEFADGAVLVKEVFKTSTGEMTTGNVSRAGTLKGWFVMVRDANGRHQGEKLWGDGWGWSWFDAAEPTKTTSTNYKADCRSCHVPAQMTGWIYIDGYPSLKK